MSVCARVWLHYGYYQGVSFFFLFFFPLAVFAPEAVSAHSRSVAVRAPRVKHVGVCFSSCVRLFGFFYVCVFRVCVCVRVCACSG